MSRFEEINKIVDEIGDADTLFEFAEKIYDRDQTIANLQHRLDVTEKYEMQINDLKQQLKSQPAEIVEKIKKQLIKRLNTIAGYGKMTTDELSFFIENEFGSDLDTILKEYQK